MQRQFIANLQARDNVDEIYRVADKQIEPIAKATTTFFFS